MDYNLGAGNANQNAAATQAQMAYAKEVAYNQVSAQPKTSESDQAIQRIAHQLERLGVNSQRLSSATDRLVGSRPKDVAQGGTIAGNPQHMPLVGKLSIIADALARLNDDNGDSVERLEQFI